MITGQYGGSNKISLIDMVGFYFGYVTDYAHAMSSHWKKRMPNG